MGGVRVVHNLPREIVLMIPTTYSPIALEGSCSSLILGIEPEGGGTKKKYLPLTAKY
jgi:hypothetical protein